MLAVQDKPLRGFDEEVRDFVNEQYRVRGLHLHPKASPTRIVKGPDGKLAVHADVRDGEPLVLEVNACRLLPAWKPAAQ